MGRGKNVLLATIGSLGDLHPCLAIALELQTRGHHVSLASTVYHRQKIEGRGIKFVALRPAISFDDTEFMRCVLRTGSGYEFFVRNVLLAHVHETFSDLVKAAERIDLMIAGETVFAAPLVAQKLGIRWASAILSPSPFLYVFDCFATDAWLEPINKLRSTF